jgi:hypothetical protein
MVVGTLAILYFPYHGFPEGPDVNDENSKYVELLFSVLGIGALVNLSFIAVRLVSFPFPLAVMDGLWCL